MFNSTILDVAAGVVFGFLAISLFTSAAVEALNSFFKVRATSLKTGIQALLNDPNFTDLAKQIYEHASISPLGPGRTNGPDTYKQSKNLPSYVEKLQFAGALLDVTGLSAVSGTDAAKEPGPQAVAALNAQLDGMTINGKKLDDQIKQLLQGTINRSGGDIKKIRAELASWFDVGMDRVSGTFKRWSLVWTFVIALPIAIVFNMDSIRIGMQLWEQRSLAETMQSPKLPASVENPANRDEALQREQEALSEIRTMTESGLPMGWAPDHFFEAIGRDGKWHPLTDAPTIFVWSLLGWIVTAVAALFGAPFWFDTLQTIIRLKGSGPSPDEKENHRAASS